MSAETLTEATLAIDCFAIDGVINPQWAPGGYAIEVDTEVKRGINTFKLSGFLFDNELSITSGEMTWRARRIGCLVGYQHGRAILNQEREIPSSWRGPRLALPGSVIASGHGVKVMPYLQYERGEWKLKFSVLEDKWNATDWLIIRVPRLT